MPLRWIVPPTNRNLKRLRVGRGRGGVRRKSARSPRRRGRRGRARRGCRRPGSSRGRSGCRPTPRPRVASGPSQPGDAAVFPGLHQHPVSLRRWPIAAATGGGRGLPWDQPAADRKPTPLPAEGALHRLRRPVPGGGADPSGARSAARLCRGRTETSWPRASKRAHIWRLTTPKEWTAAAPPPRQWDPWGRFAACRSSAATGTAVCLRAATRPGDRDGLAQEGDPGRRRGRPARRKSFGQGLPHLDPAGRAGEVVPDDAAARRRTS